MQKDTPPFYAKWNETNAENKSGSNRLKTNADNAVIFEITEGVEFEFYLFKLETDLWYIDVNNRRIELQDVTILDYLLWAYGDEVLTQEDLTMEAEYAEVVA